MASPGSPRIIPAPGCYRIALWYGSLTRGYRKRPHLCPIFYMPCSSARVPPSSRCAAKSKDEPVAVFDWSAATSNLPSQSGRLRSVRVTSSQREPGLMPFAQRFAPTWTGTPQAVRNGTLF